MRVRPTKLPGVRLVEAERHADERGYFARTWCREELGIHGLSTELAQCSLSFNQRRGTLRGMHFQRAPHIETKLVSCVRGAIFDVVIDLRPSSPTFRQSFGVTLSMDNGCAVYVPPGLAHGFLTLSDEAVVSYMISTPYEASAASGVRWNDPAFDVSWPSLTPTVMSDRDRNFPDFDPSRDAFVRA